MANFLRTMDPNHLIFAGLDGFLGAHSPHLAPLYNPPPRDILPPPLLQLQPLQPLQHHARARVQAQARPQHTATQVLPPQGAAQAAGISGSSSGSSSSDGAGGGSSSSTDGVIPAEARSVVSYWPAGYSPEDWFRQLTSSSSSSSFTAGGGGGGGGEAWDAVCEGTDFLRNVVGGAFLHCRGIHMV